MNPPKGLKYFKTGAWILLLGGCVHTVIAIFDTFLPGAFSPASDNAIQTLKDTSINLVTWLKGENTSVLESAWSAYVGFAIGVGVLLGFLGLILLLALKNSDVPDSRNRDLLIAALGLSVVGTTVSVLFYFWFPTLLFVSCLFCFVLAWFNRVKGERYVA